MAQIDNKITMGGDFSPVSYTIITPVFNRADCVCRCLDSVIRNLCHGINIEHIVVDDGSEDETSGIIQKYADKYLHIRFIRFPYNRGTNAARNAAIEAAKGDYCIILDSDDFFVDDALRTINDTIHRKTGYRHYIFAPDDMQPKYEKNFLLKGHKERVLSFVDFLSGCVSGDFIHVVKTEILRDYPFDESLRIYEGVFFLRFYHKAKRILFTNKVVTIRDRSRKDSVTREVFRTSKDVIRKTVMATKLKVDWFKDDYEKFGLYDVLSRHYLMLVDNYLLLGDYSKAKSYMDMLSAYGMKLFFYNVICILRFGWLYRITIKAYLMLKYNLLRRKLK